MSRITVSLEVESPAQETLLRRYHVFLQEMQQLALVAPEGEVIDTCEVAVLQKGQEINRQVLEQAVQTRIEALEKKVPRCGVAPVVDRASIVAKARGKS